MTAITESYTSIADSAVDPDSPLTTSLITALRDNIIHNREWLGASYTAGAVQDHSHDGVDSALVETGPNGLRNGSFEAGEGAWTFTNYSGGSHAISTSQHRHGAQSITFTSTVLANGGGEAIITAYTPIAEGEDYPWKFWVWASAANISSKVQLVWYDNAKGSLSTTDIYSSTNTPTSAALQRGATTAPANARWVRLKLIGGVPATGASTGTIRFDGVVFSDTVAVNGTHLLAASVAQSHLKATFGDVSTTNTTGVTLTLSGGTHGFYPQTYSSGGVANAFIFPTVPSTGSGSPVTIASARTDNAGQSAVLRQYYVQASPPYDLGNGDIPLFVYAAVDAGGNVLHTYVAEDPPWANNGPTDIRADFYLNGRAYKRRRAMALARSLLRGTPAQRTAYIAAWRAADFEDVEITQAMKRADMPLIPHPFQAAMAGVAAVVLLDPVGAPNELLHQLHRAGESLPELLHGGYINVRNQPLDATVPPGTLAVPWNWKAT